MILTSDKSTSSYEETKQWIRNESSISNNLGLLSTFILVDTFQRPQNLLILLAHAKLEKTNSKAAKKSSSLSAHRMSHICYQRQASEFEIHLEKIILQISHSNNKSIFETILTRFFSFSFFVIVDGYELTCENYSKRNRFWWGKKGCEKENLTRLGRFPNISLGEVSPLPFSFFT